MQDLKNKTLEELTAIVKEQGMTPFKAKEIFRFIHKNFAEDLSLITILRLKEREELAKRYFISKLASCDKIVGNGTEKAAFRLEDGKVVETVLMDYRDGRKTVCVSSQAGCPIGCHFCATGKMGFQRNLSVAEIVSQVYYFAREHEISNIVFMGMGEPFLNFDNVISAAKILNHSLGQHIAGRKIVFSTIGNIDGIKKLAQISKQFRLAWSLVAPFDHSREALIRSAKNLPLKEIIKAFQEYQSITKRRITIEYVVLKGINDSAEDAKEVIKISKMLDAHLNLIPFNPSPGMHFECGDVEGFFARLKKAQLNVTVRNSLGDDIRAACGQLSSQNAR